MLWFQFLVRRLPIDADEELELILGSNEGQELYIAGKKQKGGHDTDDNSIRAPGILRPEATLGQIHDVLWHCHGNMV